MNQIDPRAYGALEQEVKHLAKEVEDLKDSVQEMLALMNQSKGGWKFLVAMGGVSAAVASGVTWVAAHWKP